MEACGWAVFPETSVEHLSIQCTTINQYFLRSEWSSASKYVEICIQIMIDISHLWYIYYVPCVLYLFFFFIYRGHGYNRKTSGTSKSSLRERITSGVWEDCSYPCSRKGLVRAYCCHAKDWSFGVWRFDALNSPICYCPWLCFVQICSLMITVCRDFVACIDCTN